MRPRPHAVVRAGRRALLILALVLTVPIAVLGALAGVVGAACEGWLVLVGRLADAAGWGRRH